MNTSKKYLHALVTSGLHNRKFYRHLLEKKYSFMDIYTLVLSGRGEKISPRINWQPILRNIKTINIEDEFDELNKLHIQFLIGHEIPDSLQNIPDPPLWIYYKGNREIIKSEKMAAVVGARNITSYATKSTQAIVKILVSAGYTIVSGLAQGVDALAHKTCLDYAGKTVAILGNGVNECYPRMHKKLYEHILLNQGVIMSEYPTGFPPAQYTFPERNRLISGLVDSVVVIQASLKSGSLITAAAAIDQGKNVYVVPGEIDNDFFAGSNRLIRDGAYIISNLDSLVEYVGGINEISVPVFRNEIEKEIWRKLQQESTLDDLIVYSSPLNISQLNEILLHWEMEGSIKQVEGNIPEISDLII